MKNLKESFKKKFTKDIPIEIEQDYPTHMPVAEMIEIVCAASKKIGIDSYVVLKHFQFTEEEIKAYFQKFRVSEKIDRNAPVRIPSSDPENFN